MYRSVDEFKNEVLSGRQMIRLIVPDSAVAAALAGKLDVFAGVPGDAIVKGFYFDFRSGSCQFDILHSSFEKVSLRDSPRGDAPRIVVGDDNGVQETFPLLRSAKIVMIEEYQLVDAFQGKVAFSEPIPEDALLLSHLYHEGAGQHEFLITHHSFAYVPSGTGYPWIHTIRNESDNTV